MEQAIQTWSCIHDSIHPYIEGEEDKVRTFLKEGYFCEIQSVTHGD
jgi:hypothetical protein